MFTAMCVRGRDCGEGDRGLYQKGKAAVAGDFISR